MISQIGNSIVEKFKAMSDERIKDTNSVIHWNTISRRNMNGRPSRFAVLITCGSCLKDRWVTVKNIQQTRRRSKVFTGCCRHCAVKLSWKIKRRGRPLQRKLTSQGYRKVYIPESPMADIRGEVLEHRLVVSKMLGRPLRKWEHVHHKDRDRANNCPENLELVTTQQNHVMRDALDRIDQLEALLTQYHIPIPR